VGLSGLSGLGGLGGAAKRTPVHLKSTFTRLPPAGLLSAYELKPERPRGAIGLGQTMTVRVDPMAVA
jgi:hypothetical protein